MAGFQTPLAPRRSTVLRPTTGCMVRSQPDRQYAAYADIGISRRFSADSRQILDTMCSVYGGRCLRVAVGVVPPGGACGSALAASSGGAGRFSEFPAASRGGAGGGG